ncbi:hypothetical protein TNCV_284281 [Trichonephila clavipes]|uniref:Uncharacterized protein n=1 Tax=Trichonephila clavipes TaxID=2585209 RepID=A0A8X6SJ19_TRICX|nr:hypothetical protein TNCV_284281 [Trichonephila clavipes]
MLACVQPQLGQRRLKVVQSLKNIFDSYSDVKNVMNSAVLDPTLYEMRNIMKSVRSYLDARSNGEMNNNMDDIEQCDEHLMQKDNAKENIRLFSKTLNKFCFSKP